MHRFLLQLMCSLPLMCLLMPVLMMIQPLQMILPPALRLNFRRLSCLQT